MRPILYVRHKVVPRVLESVHRQRNHKQFLEGLNRFYTDERNSKIEIQHGLWIVMNEIAGGPGEDLDRMIEAWREKDGQ